MRVPARNVRGGLERVGEGRYKCQHKKFSPHKKVLLSTNKKTTTKLTLQNILLKYFTKYKTMVYLICTPKYNVNPFL